MDKTILNRNLNITLALVLYSYICFRALSYTLIDLVTIFLYPFLWIVFYIALIVMMIIVLIRLFKNTRWKTALIALLVCALIAVLPINTCFEFARFYALRGIMQNTAENVLDGEYAELPDLYESSAIPLPNGKKFLSRGGGDVYVINDGRNTGTVMFYTYCGIIDGYKGFVYFKGSGNYYTNSANKCIKVASHWYYVSGE